MGGPQTMLIYHLFVQNALDLDGIPESMHKTHPLVLSIHPLADMQQEVYS